MPAAVVKTVFSADTSQVKKGVATVKRSLNGLKSAAVGIGGAITGALAIGGFRQMMNDLDRIGKLSKRLNVSTDTMQKLSYAADLAGADVEAVAKAMTRATIAGQDAADGLTTMTRAFEDLGINVADFNKLSPEEQIKAVSDAFNASGQSSEAYAAVLKILGTRAQELIPLLKEMSETMDKAPLVSPEAIKGAEDFNDALTGIKAELMAIAALPMGKIAEKVQAFKGGAEEAGSTGGSFFTRMWQGLGAKFGAADRETVALGEDKGERLVAAKKRAKQAAPGNDFGLSPAELAEAEAASAAATRRSRLRQPAYQAQSETISGVLPQGKEVPYGNPAGQSMAISSLARIGGGGGVGGIANKQLKEARTTNSKLDELVDLQKNRGNVNAEFRLLP